MHALIATLINCKHDRIQQKDQLSCVILHLMLHFCVYDSQIQRISKSIRYTEKKLLLKLVSTKFNKSDLNQVKFN